MLRRSTESCAATMAPRGALSYYPLRHGPTTRGGHA